MPRSRSPKRGSLAYLPRGRAKSIVGRVRNWPDYKGDPKILGLMGYKAGMTHAVIVENRKNSPWFGQEVSVPLTVLDIPPLVVCGFRGYKKTYYGLKAISQVWTQELNEDLRRKLTIPKEYKFDDALKKFQSKLSEITELRAIIHTQPRLAGVPKKKPDLAEFKVSGGAIEDQFNYLKDLLGKELRARDLFNEGGYVDTIAISKGKGFQGPVKRWGIRILQNKSRKTKRGVGSIGPWHPARVSYTVPRAGQMGFHQRTEYNKRILKIGEDASEIMPKGGILSYGSIKRDYMLIEGTIIGTRKRLVKLRYPIRNTKELTDKPPEIVQLSIESKQGS
jgi:large subunit ribosomal protein L3